MKLNRIIKQIISILAGIVCIFLLIINLFYINNIDSSEFSVIERCGVSQIAIYIGIIFGIFIICFLVYKIRINRIIKSILTCFIFGTYMIISFIWVSKAITIPFADSAQIMEISKSISGFSNLTEYSHNYLAYYPQQITLSVLFSGVFNAFGKVDYRIIEYLNVVCNLISMIGLSFILKHFSKKYTVNRAVFFVFSLTFLPVILLATFVYGDFIGMPFLIWALYMALKFVESNKKRYVMITCILTAIGCLFRMNYIIFAIAIVLYWLINICLQEHFNIKRWLYGFIIVSIFVVIAFIPSTILKKIYMNKYSIDSSKSFLIILYVYMGMSEGDRGYGWYNNAMGDKVYHMMSDSKEQSQKISQECRDELNARIKFLVKNPMYTIKFYTYKNISMWAEPTMEASFYNGFIEEGKKIEEHPLAKSVADGKIKNYTKLYQKALIILILFSTILVIIFNRKDGNCDIYLFTLVFLGGFSFHMLWEAKSRYIIPYYISLIPIATIGLSMFMEKIDGTILKNKKRKGNVIIL